MANLLWSSLNFISKFVIIILISCFDFEILGMEIFDQVIDLK